MKSPSATRRLLLARIDKGSQKSELNVSSRKKYATEKVAKEYRETPKTSKAFTYEGGPGHELLSYTDFLWHGLWKEFKLALGLKPLQRKGNADMGS